HVIVAEQEERLLVTQQLARACREAPHPRELIGELVGADGIAVGQIEVADAHHTTLSGHAHLNVTRMTVAVVAGQAAHGDFVERALGENGDAVEALLPVHGDVIAVLLEGRAWKGLAGRLDLLQAEDVRGRLLDPRQGDLESGLDAVDVPGGDLHGSMCMGICSGLCFWGYALGYGSRAGHPQGQGAERAAMRAPRVSAAL